MPVIGRLDKQVEDVLIAPISKRRRDDEREPEQTEEPDATPTQTPPADESSVKRDELPVWLL